MIDRLEAGILIAGMSIIGSMVFFYQTVPEEWMKVILISTIFWVGSLWLSSFWALKVVFPFVKSVTENTAAKAGRSVPVWVGRGAASRWMLGIGVPLMIGLLEGLSLLFYSGGWIGTIPLAAFVLVLVRVLQYYSFFTEPVGPETQIQKEEA